MNKITPFLWYDTQAEQAVDSYLTVFENAKKGYVLRGPDGKAVTVAFELEGQKVTALNGGPGHQLNEAFSFVVACKTQAEIDGYWEKFLAAGGKELACGWIKDQFGLCWQVCPENLGHLVAHPKAFQAMLTMKKLDMDVLEAAAKES